MLDKIQLGLSATVETHTISRHSTANYGSGEINVFSTPAMIGLMESAAKNSVDLHLPMGCTTVGTKIDIRHIAATPIGMKVKCTAELIQIDERRLVFKVEAFDEIEKIGEGLHERYIVEIDKFIKKIDKKTNK